MNETEHTLSKRARMRLIIFLFASNLLASFMQSIMNIALDQVAAEFHVRLAEANLVIIVFAIVAGTIITMAASLLKRFGLRKIMLFGLITAALGSFLGYVAWSFPVMVVARVIQAFTTALFFPVINEALLTLSPKGKAGILLSIDSAVIGAGLAVAPPVSGLLITFTGLRSLFLVPAALAVILLLVGPFVLHDIYPRENRPIDAVSVILSFIGLSAFMVGLNELSHYPWPMVALMVLGIGIMALFVWRQTRIAHPLLNMNPFRTKAYSIGETLIVLSYMASMFLSLMIPLFLEGSAGFTTFMAGCMLSLPILCYAGMCFVSGRELGKHGVWPIVPLGFVIMIVGMGAMIFAIHVSNAVAIGVLICTALVYGGVGLLYPAVKSVDLEVLPTALSSNGSAIHSTLVQIAGCVSSALYVGIFSGTVSTDLAKGIAKTEAYASAFSLTLLIELGFILAAIIISVLYVRAVRRASKQA